MPRRSAKNSAMLSVARKLFKAGIKTAIITMASQGCLVVQGEEIVRVYAPKVKAVDGSGAGATFSSGFIYGYLKGWSLEESVRFAIAAASLKVTHSGLKMFPVKEIKALAGKLRVEHMIYRDDQFYTIKKLLHLPQEDRFADNPLVKEGGSWQKKEENLREKLLPKKKPQQRRKIKRSLVE